MKALVVERKRKDKGERVRERSGIRGERKGGEEEEKKEKKRKEEERRISITARIKALWKKTANHCISIVEFIRKCLSVF